LSTIFQNINPPPSKAPKVIGYVLAVAALIWVLHDFHLMQALHELANVKLKWMLLGVGFDVLSYGVQGMRWTLLLNPFGKVRLTRAVRAVYAGLFANAVFPLRPGELLRSYLLSESERITLGRVIGSVGVERLVDLVIATAALAIVSLLVDLPRRFRRVADTLGIVTLVLLTIVVLLILYLELKLGNRPPPEGQPRRFSGKVMAALIGLHAMGTAPSFYSAILASVLMPFCQVVGLWAMMRSYRLNLPFLAAVVVLIVINLGVSLPNAPANIGSYQFFCVVGLNVFQVEKTTATAFSFFAFFGLTVPIVLLGFVALLRSGMSLRSMREQLGSFPSKVSSSAA
jgi:glycosyltransferase 2 family protein